MLHDAAGAVRAHSGKGPGYCYMIGRGPNTSLLGEVTVLLFFLYAKSFPPPFSILSTFETKRCELYYIMSWQVKTLLRSWEFLLMANLRYAHFVLQKSTRLQSKHFGVEETCTELCRTVDFRVTMSLKTFFLELWGVNTLQKERRTARFLAIFWIQRWKFWKIMAVPKFKISLMKECGCDRVTHAHTRPHFTVQSARQICLVTG